MRRIHKGDRIVEYKGERITHAAAHRRYPDDDAHTMLFTVNARVVIDPANNGNSARWINHSCSPNCETEQDDGRVYINAMRDIKPGEELTYDYRLYLDEPHTAAAKAMYPCSCGARDCRRTMLCRKR